ncbi:MAG: phage portal protein [Alphaproteobacteria bacterium]|nr:phage portal protein [Alphaproteobacteria bacterium]
MPNLTIADDNDDSFELKIKSDADLFKKSIDSGFEDPFMQSWDELQKLDGLSANFKRRANRLAKSFTGIDDAKSKKLDPLDLTGYSLFQIVQPPYNVLYLAQLFDISPFHHAAVNAKVANVIGLGYNFVETQRTIDKIEDVMGDDKKLENLRRKIARGKRDLEEYLESMNSDDTFLETMKKIYTDYETTGNAFLEIGRTSSGKIGYIGHIPTITMRIRRHRDGFVQVVYNRYTFFRNYGDTTTEDQIGTDPRPNEVIHFKKYAATNTYYGLPDILSAKNAIAGDEFASRFNLDYFENKAVPRYIITVKGARLNADSERKLLEFFQTGLRGRNHRTLYIPLPSDGENSRVEFNMEPIEAGVQDSSFKNYTVENRDRIFIAHRVPISKVGTPDGISLANARDADKTFKEQVCRPAQQYLEERINKFISEFTDAFKIKFNELALTDEETQSRIDDVYLRNQVIVPNDVRVRKGLAPRPGGDDPVILKPEQQSEQVSQATKSRSRDQKRQMNAPDKQGEARNPKGDGRKV